MSVVITICKR